MLSAYIYILSSNSNLVVGLTATTNGIAQLVFALPFGWLADRFRRDRVLYASATIGVASVVVSLYSFAYHSLPLIYVVMALWGAFSAASNA